MKSAEFRKYVSKYFAPKIRMEGWKGSGLLYRKENEFPVLFLMGFQIKSSGGSFIIEYSIYFPFVYDIRKGRLALEKIQYANAELWCRNRISDGGEWFEIPDTEQEIKTLLEIVWDKFRTTAFPEFERSLNFIERTDDIIANEETIIAPADFPFKLSGKTRARELMTLAEIFRYKGNKGKVKEYCSLAIKLIGDNHVGSGLIPLLNEMMDE